MIAKNEESWIGQAIRSVLPIIKETILVDTGSTDNTVAIATELGAKIYHVPWNDDFSAPRNISLQHATGDWILVLDADEAISEKDYPTLLSHMNFPNQCYEMPQRHYSNDHRLSDFQPVRGEHPEFERHYGGYFESGLVRFFPNNRGVKYIGRIHELVEHSIYKIPGLNIVKSPVRLHHYGHTDEVKKKKNKARLYTPLGETKIKETPNHWQAFFELGVEHNCNGRPHQSVEFFLKSLALYPEYVPCWVNLGYVYCEIGDHKRAVQALGSALELDPKNDEAYCNLSVVYLRVPHFPSAEKYARRAIAINPTYVNAFCNLGKSLAHQGRLAEAALIYERALEILPRCASAKLDLGTIYFTAKQPLVAERYLKELVEENPDYADARYTLSAIYQATARTEEAVLELKKFCELLDCAREPLSTDQLRALEHARMQIQSLRITNSSTDKRCALR